MIQNFYLRQKIGDLIYCIPAIRSLTQRRVNLYHGMDSHLFMKDFFDDQDINLIHEREGIPEGFVNFEPYHNMPNVNSQHISKTIGQAIRANVEISKPWLVALSDSMVKRPYAVVSVTPRYRDRLFNWRNEASRLWWEYGKSVYFIGTLQEWIDFQTKYKTRMRYAPVVSLRQAAGIIRGCDVFSGTQSAMLALAQGLGKRCRIERSPNMDTCYTGKETVLNPVSRKIYSAICNANNFVRGLVP